MDFLNKSSQISPSLGDIVGYGDSPDKYVDLVRQRVSTIDLGNHDQAAAEPSDADYFTKPGKIAAKWTNKTLTDENPQFLAALPVTEMGSCTLVHASGTRIYRNGMLGTDSTCKLRLKLLHFRAGGHPP